MQGKHQTDDERHLLDQAERLAHFGSFEWDPRTDHLVWSEEMFRIYGVDPLDFTGRLTAFLDRVHPDDREQVQTEIAEAIAAGASFGSRERIIRPDGELRWLATSGSVITDASGMPTRVVGVCHDVTEQVHAREQADRGRRRLEALLSTSSEAVLVIDPSGELLYAGGAMNELLDHEREELLGFAIVQHLHPEDRERVHAAVIAASQPASDAVTVEWRMQQRDGSYRWLESTAVNLVNDPAIGGIVANCRDITERKQREANEIQRKLYDAVTGLPNRKLLTDRLERAVAQHAQRPAGFAVLIVDIDVQSWVSAGFDERHHPEALRDIGERLRGRLRHADMLASVRPSMFAAICDPVGPDAARKLAREVADVARVATTARGRLISTDVRVGVAFASPGDRVTAEEMLREAELAVYQARERAGAAIQVFGSADRIRIRELQDTERRLRVAIDGGHVIPHYQPIMDLRSGEIAGFEALARWAEPDAPVRMPKEFIEVAEDSGLIVPLGAAVLAEACRDAARWNGARDCASPLQMTVNLSVRQLLSPSFVDVLTRALADADLSPRLLTLEITESVLLTDHAGAEDAVRALKDIGVHIAVDDFGTGYSSLAYLRRYPIDALKIDRSFVNGLLANRRDRAIVRWINELAHECGLTTIVEGVESEEQAAALLDLGCQHAQGFLWSPPMPAFAFDSVSGADGCGPDSGRTSVA